MPRISKSYLTARFERVAAAMQWDITSPVWSRNADNTNRATVGRVMLQHNSYYGWNVSQISNKSGGERRIIGSCKAAELDSVFEGILIAKTA